MKKRRILVTGLIIIAIILNIYIFMAYGIVIICRVPMI